MDHGFDGNSHGLPIAGNLDLCGLTGGKEIGGIQNILTRRDGMPSNG
jgi:hypothetical protein